MATESVTPAPVRFGSSEVAPARATQDRIDIPEFAPSLLPDGNFSLDDRFLDREMSWLDFNARVLELAEDPDLFLLVEASARDGYYVENGFDAAYDWSGQLGEWAWDEVFGEGRVDLARLRAALTNEGKGYPHDSLILRFLNNNDTGERFISRYGLGPTRVAAALTFTLPGVPLIYTGDEVGAEFEPYDEGPPLSWQDPHELLSYYRQLAQLRRETPALWSRELDLIETDRDDRVLAFLRPGKSAERSVLVLLNFSDEAVTVGLGTMDKLAALTRNGQAVDRLSGETVKLDGKVPSLRLPPYGVRVLEAPPE